MLLLLCAPQLNSVAPPTAKGFILFIIRACLHGVGGPELGEVTRLSGVTRLSI